MAIGSVSNTNVNNGNLERAVGADTKLGDQLGSADATEGRGGKPTSGDFSGDSSKQLKLDEDLFE